MNSNTNTTAPATSATELVKRIYPSMTSASDEIEIVVDLIRPIRHALRADPGFLDEKDFSSFALTLDAVVEALVEVGQRIPGGGKARPADETIDQRIESLFHEFSLALAGYANGQFKAVVYPTGYPDGYCLRPIGSTPESRVKNLMRELSVELTHWNGGGYRAVVYPVDNEQQSSLQDLLLMPEEPGARPGSPSIVARKIATAQDNLLEAHSLNIAVMLATEGVPDGAAIQAVARAVEVKLNLARDQLEAIREALS